MAKNIKLDQFYTDSNEVQKCIKAIKDARIDLSSFDIVLEPSAGTGAFYSVLPIRTRIGLDLDPKYPGVIQQDFFNYSPTNIFSLITPKVITVGNPPYGKAGSLAMKFLNRCGEFSDYVCLVLPRSFKKISLQNRVNLDLHLIHQHDVDDFILPDGTVSKVRSVFQIWSKSGGKREKIVKRKTSTLWDWTKPQDADCAMIFFGTPTGKLKVSKLDELTTSTHQFMRSNIPLDELIQVFELSSEEIKDTYRGSNTAAGSLSRGDVVEIVERNYYKMKQRNT